MWRRKSDRSDQAAPGPAHSRLHDALYQARIAQAERTSVVVDLRDADLARLDLLNTALDPLFAELPAEVTLFDRGLSHGDTPRLWIDAVAFVALARDKRTYRFLQDTRAGRIILAESPDLDPVVDAITRYVAQRMIEREHALAAPLIRAADDGPRRRRSSRLAWGLAIFGLGIVCGIALLFIAAYLAASGWLGR